MAQKYVGIDLGSHRVKIAVVTAGLRGVQLVDAFAVPLAAATPNPAGDDGSTPDPYLPALQAALAALRSKGLLSESVGIALPAAAVSYRLLSFPFAEERRIAQTIAFEADGQFPVPLEQLAYGHVVVPAPQGGRALMVAAKRERVEQLATIFKRVGADLEVVTSGGMALAQVVDGEVGAATPELAEQGLQPVTLVLDLGHGSTEIVAMGTKGPIAVRSIRRGGRHVTAAIMRAFGLEASTADEAKERDAFVPHRGQPMLTDDQMRAGALVAQAIEPIVREIESTRLWLRSTHRCEVTRLVLAGGGAHLGGLDGYLTEQTGLPCGPAKLKPQIPVRGIEGRDIATFGIAIGTAWGAARRPLLQLHDDTARQSDSSWIQERIGSLAAIGIAVMAFGAVDTIVRVNALDAEREAYVLELEDTTKKVFGEAVALADVGTMLDSAESQDITSLIAQRGALEVLALIAQAATPSDLGKNPILPPAAATPDGGDDGGEDDPAAEAAEPTPPPVAVAETVKLESGVVASDELLFTLIDIRERKIEVKVEARRASAQERFAYRLKDISCFANIEKSKVKGDDRKVFEMSIDNNCYYASSLSSNEESEDSSAESPSAPTLTPKPAGEDAGGSEGGG
jgi:type IV pilus assembly protein PilM